MDGNVFFYDWQKCDSRELRTFRNVHGQGAATSVSLSGDGKVLSVGRSGGVTDVYDVASVKNDPSKQYYRSGNVNRAAVAAFLPRHGRILITAGLDHTLRIHDIASEGAHETETLLAPGMITASANEYIDPEYARDTGGCARWVHRLS